MMSRAQQNTHALRQLEAGRERLVKLRAKALEDVRRGDGGERARAAASWLTVQIATADDRAEEIRREIASC